MTRHLTSLASGNIRETILGAIAQKSPVNDAPQEVLLSKYPPLGQQDALNYDPESLAETLDYPENIAVKKLACLATVYVMLERGRGNHSAMIDGTFYRLGVGAINPGYVANRSSEIDGDLLKGSLDSGNPIVLQGVNNQNGLVHFVLAVGYKKQKNGSMEVLINDPWRGTRISLPFESGHLTDRQLGLSINKMRAITN